ncbi:DUF2249 domain-containing protein [Salinibacter ruber]|uniref:DUF2249 domain-containing protein n=1 Tax=Salinibacter ruber TaxID=146919 RepID=UPI002166CA32|nr:DUF2249 domain-containing protein [Salinibacter ruber]MCS3702010.1 uncharacterized protein (DUF2249 family) [Salinibacter ruber]
MSTTVPTILDVRPLQAERKFESVLVVLDGLDAGESFVLVDDVYPRTLRLRIRDERSGAVRWAYLKKGPRVWCVRVERGPAALQEGVRGEGEWGNAPPDRSRA